MDILKDIKYDANGLVPAIVQDFNTGDVLMLAYMNSESLKKTVETGRTWFYSRSRQSLWNKGETSGNFQNVKNMYFDCDADSILVQVEQIGPACHTGSKSCFFNKLVESDEAPVEAGIMGRVYELITERKENPVDGSYTNYLFDKGIDKILKKVGEEASEVIIGAKNSDKGETVYEISDLVYHLLVLMVHMGIEIDDIKRELDKRYKK
ncbi:histidine biosynthesis bifunctional protein hisIE [Peptoclostridium acidaminophilum DSM 3953]|uniref:Histidine biosynthesis bifunctional protein HisIE n=1 Tax=Peptoclostridium acidaminophilum DSM 3953 TaxID=1286171 RepID=W8TFV5_PEPAC|nr:bifunctional phosphoribosyl-AMP cyclohydrolase/phosphoribosyl-ATP diphosphatase HisIE [Peptoclostridium acidaminophilum]AHM56703.1 histidine biosynthesis bifunctional protein hisIE [Peptoclostridium acidaminophilum DSM 3953]